MVQTIHHTQVKKAQQMGVELTTDPDFPDLVAAYWPSRSLKVFGIDAKNAMQQMQAAIRMIEKHEGDGDVIKFTPDAEPTKKRLSVNGVRYVLANTPMAWAQIDLDKWAKEQPEQGPVAPVEGAPLFNSIANMPVREPNGTDPNSFIEDIAPTIDGVPTNGRVAHQKGFAIVDCPFANMDFANFQKWEEEWEASADEAVQNETEEEKEPSGSVVKSKFRVKYAELGHPTHCGDELAVKLNNLVGGSKTNIEYFQMILATNGVDMTKYKTEGPGWQGRYRMTGRIKLAKTLHGNGGVLKLPNDETLQMSQEWLASQRFKK